MAGSRDRAAAGETPANGTNGTNGTASHNGHVLHLGNGKPSVTLPQRNRPFRAGPVKRVLFIGKNMSRTRCTGGLVDALQRHGVEVRWRNMVTLRRWFGGGNANRIARFEYRRFRPDTVMVFNTDLPPQLAAEFRETSRLVVWCEEPLVAVEPSLLDYFALADLVCLSNPTRLPLLREQGLDNLAFLMSGFAPKYHRPAPRQAPLRDVAFIGTPGRLGQRAELLATVAKHFHTEVFGLHWKRWPQYCGDLQVSKPIGNREYAQVCATSKIVLGMNEVNDDPSYFSNRTFLTLACRAFHLTHYVPRLEQVFRDGEHLSWFHGDHDICERIAHWLPLAEERDRIAGVGLAEVVQHHQYYHRVARILNWLQYGLPKFTLEDALAAANHRSVPQPSPAASPLPRS
ncbi:MAG: glycosyltransferase [Planctomycetota bacterium]